MKNILKKLDTLQAELAALRPLDAETNARLEQKLNIEQNWNSNAIEGNTLTLGETRTFLLYGITAKGKPFRDYLEIAGHNEALDYVAAAVKNHEPLTQSFCRFLHKILLGEKPFRIKAMSPDGQPATREIHPGEYKQQPNSVMTSTGQMFYYAPPGEVPSRMADLFDWYKQQLAMKTHGLLIACEFHYRFVRIHPFDDGNGRMARLLMNLILMQHGYPVAVVPVKKRKEYIAALEMADASGEITGFIDFIGSCVSDTIRLTIKAAHGEDIWQDSSPISSPISSPNTAGRILDLIRENPGISTSQMGENIGIGKRAVLKQIEKLKLAGRLRRTGSAKSGHWEVIC